MKTSCLLIVLVVILWSCGEGPTGPVPEELGVLVGQVEVNDARLQRLDDASGVIVRFHDFHGKTFETTTDTSGRWELELPNGVYYLDTIQHPTLHQLHIGFYWGGSADYKTNLIFFDHDRKFFAVSTQFYPEPLDTLVSIENPYIDVDTTFVPAHTENNVFYPDEYVVKVEFHCFVLTTQLCTNIIDFSIRTSSGTTLYQESKQLENTYRSLLVETSTSFKVKDISELENATFVLNTRSIVTQVFLIPDSERPVKWKLDTREVPNPSNRVEYPLF